MEHPLAARAMRLLGDRVVACERLHGGDLSEVLRLRLASGKDVVVKSGPGPGQEARMLLALSAGGADAPTPLAWDTDVLVLDHLGPPAPPSARAWQALGATLRSLHGTSGDRYGWDEDHAFGDVRIRNGWSRNWAGFWFERRLMADHDTLPATLLRRLEKLEARITDLLPAHPLPALLHGDLWSGNVHFTSDGKAWLIDPASYYGHHEVDLAMLTLFGNPPQGFWEAYRPLEEGWPLRRHVYQLWPALVHLRLFGASYRPLVEGLIAAVETAAPDTAGSA